jgi:hypothetical protein
VHEIGCKWDRPHSQPCPECIGSVRLAAEPLKRKALTVERLGVPAPIQLKGLLLSPPIPLTADPAHSRYHLQRIALTADTTIAGTNVRRIELRRKLSAAQRLFEPATHNSKQPMCTPHSTPRPNLQPLL